MPRSSGTSGRNDRGVRMRILCRSHHTPRRLRLSLPLSLRRAACIAPPVVPRLSLVLLPFKRSLPSYRCRMVACSGIRSPGMKRCITTKHRHASSVRQDLSGVLFTMLPHGGFHSPSHPLALISPSWVTLSHR